MVVVLYSACKHFLLQLTDIVSPTVTCFGQKSRCVLGGESYFEGGLILVAEVETGVCVLSLYCNIICKTFPCCQIL